MLSGMAQPDLEHVSAMSRASACARETTAATAQRVLELEGGVAVFHDDLASVWDLNLLWLDTVSPDATAESLAALAETLVNHEPPAANPRHADSLPEPPRQPHADGGFLMLTPPWAAAQKTAQAGETGPEPGQRPPMLDLVPQRLEA